MSLSLISRDGLKLEKMMYSLALEIIRTMHLGQIVLQLIDQKCTGLLPPQLECGNSSAGSALLAQLYKHSPITLRNT